MVLLALIVPGPVSGQVQVGGLVDFVGKNASEPDVTNETFAGASTLHSLRARLFFDAPLDGRHAAFVQLFFDDYKINVYGAYVRLNEVAGRYVNLHVGMIPNTIGNFGPRTYSNINPLVGTPLLWVHHSSYQPGTTFSRTADELIGRRDDRSNQKGLPMLYDHCWNTGVEAYGSIGSFDYSLGVLSGSVTKPTIQQNKDIPQLTGKVSWFFGPELTVGVNGFAGPYLYDGMITGTLPEGKEAEDYMNLGGGIDAAFVKGYLEVYSELFYSVWEHPYLDDLTASSGYLEATYTVFPGWYASGRFGFFEPGKLTNGAGQPVHWDYPVKRYEFGVGYKPTRRITAKLVAQFNRFDFTDEFDTEHYLVQLGVML